VSTPLELLFDLTFVVAIAAAASQLHHAVGEHHLGSGMLAYFTSFAAIWWAWMNFTWFASAYDTDDPTYRLWTMVQMVGVLILAAVAESAHAVTPTLAIGLVAAAVGVYLLTLWWLHRHIARGQAQLGGHGVPRWPSWWSSWRRWPPACCWLEPFRP